MELTFDKQYIAAGKVNGDTVYLTPDLGSNDYYWSWDLDRAAIFDSVKEATQQISSTHRRMNMAMVEEVTLFVVTRAAAVVTPDMIKAEMEAEMNKNIEAIMAQYKSDIDSVLSSLS